MLRMELTRHEKNKIARTALGWLLDHRLQPEVEAPPQVHLAQGDFPVRRYVCPQCQGTCRCGTPRPPDSLTSGHFSAAAIIMFIFALGGLGKLIVWLFTVNPVLGLIFGVIFVLPVLIVIIALTAGSFFKR